MSTRSEFLRDAFLLAGGIGIFIGLGVGAGLWLGSAFSLLLFARLLLMTGLLLAPLEFFVLRRTFRPHTLAVTTTGMWRADRTQGCTLALLIGLVLLGLLTCGGFLEYVLEFRH